jgi:hypothetical protein
MKSTFPFAKLFFVILLFSFIPCLSVKSQNYYWANTIGSTGDEKPGDICIDANNNIINVGSFSGIADVDAGPIELMLTSNGDVDAFVVKYDSNGNILWAKSFGQLSEDIAEGVTTDANGNIYVVGSFVNTVDFNPGSGVNNYTSLGGGDAYILKLDPNGNFIWAKTFGSANYDEANSIAISATGDILVSGYFAGTTDFNTGPASNILTSIGFYDPFVLKLDSMGDFVWAKSFSGSSDYDFSIDVAVDASGNVYMAGNFEETLDLNPGIGVNSVISNGFSDIYFVKLDANGNFIWGESIGNSGINSIIALEVDSVGNVFAGGYFFDAMDFDPGPSSLVLSDGNYWGGFLMKMNTNGEIIWANSITSTTYADVRDLAINSSGNIYLAGRLNGTADLISGSGTYNVTAVAGDDIFTAAYNTNGTFLWGNSAGGPNLQYAENIAVDNDGFTYSIGFLAVSADLNPQSGVNNFVSAGSDDVFIVKLGPCLTPTSLGNINSSGSFCAGQTATFSVSPQSGLIGYTWTVPSGSSIVSGQNTNSIQVLLGSQSGNVQVYPIGNCNNGPVSSSSLVINSLPNVSVTATPSNVICAGQSITLNGQGAVSYSISNGVNNGIPFVPASGGNYLVVGTDINGCTDSETINISVNPLPIVGATANPTDTICAGDTIILNGSGALNYLWNNGIIDGLAFVPSSSQTYTVTGIDANGCSQTASIPVIINTNVNIVMQPLNDTAEFATNAIFVVQNIGSGANYQWQINIGTGFVDLSNFGSYTGANNDTLFVSNVNMGMNNYGFRCIVSDGNCSEISEFAQLVVTNVTSLNLNNNKPTLTIYPNPTTNNINIEISRDQIGKQFVLIDVNGSVVYSCILDQVNKVISIANLANGIYWGKIEEAYFTGLKVVKL